MKWPGRAEPRGEEWLKRLGGADRGCKRGGDGGGDGMAEQIAEVVSTTESDSKGVWLRKVGGGLLIMPDRG